MAKKKSKYNIFVRKHYIPKTFHIHDIIALILIVWAFFKLLSFGGVLDFSKDVEIGYIPEIVFGLNVHVPLLF